MLVDKMAVLMVGRMVAAMADRKDCQWVGRMVAQ